MTRIIVKLPLQKIDDRSGGVASFQWRTTKPSCKTDLRGLVGKGRTKQEQESLWWKSLVKAVVDDIFAPKNYFRENDQMKCEWKQSIFPNVDQLRAPV